VNRRWFKLKPGDENFLSSASQRMADTMEIARSAESVWSDLTSDDTLSWCRLLAGVTWTSARPFGQGTTRTVRTPFGLALKEVYFRWEEGTRKSFYVAEATAPLFRTFAEDYLVEETSPSSCLFTWTVAFETPAAARAGNPINRLITRSLFRDTRRHFGVG
jgi:Polyketide cyclase / dehydrase and lipid transport